MRRTLVTFSICAAAVLVFVTGAGDRNVETDALQTIQKLHTAEIEFQSRFGRYGNFEDLRPLMQAGFASRSAAGYRFYVRRRGTGYEVVACADTPEYRRFYSDESLKVRYASRTDALCQRE